MNVGNPTDLRAMGSRLAAQAADTERVRTQITGAASSLDGSLDGYARRALHVFHARWSHVGGVLRDLEDAARDVSSGLGQLATALDGAERDWSGAWGQAVAAGFRIEGDPPVVTAPADAAADAVARASQLEQQLRAAAGEAERARAQLQRRLDSVPLHRLSVLTGARCGGVALSTGSPALDEQAQRVVAALLAAHQSCARGA